MMPDTGDTVVTLNRKGNARYGEVVETRYDGRYHFFTVDYGGDPGLKVEYPASAWWGSVQPVTCPVCDSTDHHNHPGE